MSKEKDLSTADKDTLLSYLQETGNTMDPKASLPMIREKAMEVQDALGDDGDSLDSRAKAAADSVLDEEEDDDDSGESQPRLPDRSAEKNKPVKRKLDIESKEVQPHDGESASINKIISSDFASGDDQFGETLEGRILREQERRTNDIKNARLVAAADAGIAEYHKEAARKHGAKITDICFFLLKGTKLSSFTSPYTNIPGIRLRKETPYRSLDVELKYFRGKRNMFGECAYEGGAVTED